MVARHRALPAGRAQRPPDRDGRARQHDHHEPEGVGAEIRAELLARAWSEKRQAFVESFEGEALDASVLLMAEVGIIINIILIVLNLIPLPPLDGSRIVAAFLSPAAAIAERSRRRARGHGGLRT